MEKQEGRGGGEKNERHIFIAEMKTFPPKFLNIYDTFVLYKCFYIL